jgi:hypothetical protein
MNQPTAQPAIEAPAICPWCNYKLPLPGRDYEYCPDCGGSFGFRKPIEPDSRKADQPASEPRLAGWGRHPESRKLLHFDVEGFGERICVFRVGNGWRAVTYRTIDEIEAALNGK